jgi:hypothetical protein
VFLQHWNPSRCELKGPRLQSVFLSCSLASACESGKSSKIGEDKRAGERASDVVRGVAVQLMPVPSEEK